MGPSKRAPRGILAIWNDCRKGAEPEYEAWYRGEHLTERLSIPGFRASWRFRACDGEPEYFSFYETADPEVLFSVPYVTRVDNPSALTTRIMSGIFTNATRALLTATAQWGTLRGTFAVSVRFDKQPGSGLEPALSEMAARPDVVRAELWTPTQKDAPVVLSAEQKLRGPDKSVASAALVETVSESEARAVAAALRAALGAGPHIGVYQLFCSLDRQDLD